MSGAELYERLGRREGISAVVDDFYDRLVADDELGPFFEDAGMEPLRRTQTDFLCEAAGGPETDDAKPVGGTSPPSVHARTHPTGSRTPVSESRRV